MKPMKYGSRFTAAALTIALIALATGRAGVAQAADAALKAALRVPADFPLGLPTVLMFDCPAAPKDCPYITVHHAGLDPERTIAQREIATGKFLAMAAIRDRALVGSTTDCAAAPPPRDPSAPVGIVSIQQAPAGYEFRDGGRLVMLYHKDPLSRDGKHTRANYIHPLNGLDGETFSQDFPDDHKHQRGLFWAWHRLFVGDQKLGDNWATTDFLSVVKKVDIVEQGPVFATLRVSVDWTSDLLKGDNGMPKPVVDETTTIRLFQAAGGVEYVDLEVVLKPLLPDVKFGGAEVSHGYSGFTVRVKPPQGMAITAQTGKLKGDAEGEGIVSSWADASGSFGEKGDSGVAILCHPTLPVFPAKWVLRHYGMQNDAYPGVTLVTLPQDHPLVLRHRILVHRSDATTARAADHQRSYELGDGK